VATAEGPTAPAVAPHLARLPGHLIRRAGQVHTEMWTRYVSGSVSSVQYAVVSTLARHEPLDQASIARLVALDPASTHAVVHRLKDAGYLTMERSPQDGRRFELRLTDTGHALCADLEPRVEQLRQAFESRLPPEETTTFLRLLEEFVTADRAGPGQFLDVRTTSALNEPGHTPGRGRVPPRR
jgi:MarR family transcriptional regulator, lower aerobic nicotinate degradation pathway regulator